LEKTCTNTTHNKNMDTENKTRATPTLSKIIVIYFKVSNFPYY